ncbi:MAG: MBL fold metallo-hydrolase [Bacteroidota bacterium]
MIRPLLQDDAFLEDVTRARQSPQELHLWWLGQSGFLIQWQGRHLLIDPYLSDSLTRKYAGTDRPHVRMTERVIDPGRLDFIDAVTSSHNHTDHLDAETLIPLMQANAGLKLLVGGANLAFAAERLGVPTERLTPLHAAGPGVSVPPFQFHAIPSAHETLEYDEQGEPRCLGLVLQAGPWTVYHSGDCVPHEGLPGQLGRWKIDLALLPINGRDAARGVPGNFTAEEAVQLGREIEAGLVVPCHYEMFEFNSVPPQEFVRAAKRGGQPYRLLRAGERLGLKGGQPEGNLAKSSYS